MRVIVTPQADRDLDEIGAYIARDNRRAAVRVLTAIRARIRRLGKFPGVGQTLDVPGRSDLRRLVWRSYLVVYRVTENAVVVARILHGARDLPLLLGAGSSEPEESE